MPLVWWITRPEQQAGWTASTAGTSDFILDQVPDLQGPLGEAPDEFVGRMLLLADLLLPEVAGLSPVADAVPPEDDERDPLRRAVRAGAVREIEVAPPAPTVLSGAVTEL